MSEDQREFDDKRGGEIGRPSPASPSIAVTHDPDGNLLEDARNTYTWNADNNLICVDAKDGTLRLEYVYDSQSRRTVRTETRQPGTKNEEQRTTFYLCDDWNLLAEFSQAPADSSVNGAGEDNLKPETLNLRLFSWGRDLSGSLQGAGGVGGLLAISEVNPSAEEPSGAQLKTPNLSRAPETGGAKLETRFPAYDANGNIGQLLDERGKTVAVYVYEPFGNVAEMAGAEAAENEWRFSAKPVEAGTGWLYYGYRWYDAEMGRWVSRDPIEESGGVNLYGFVGNDGVGKVDKFGRITLTVNKCEAYVFIGHSSDKPRWEMSPECNMGGAVVCYPGRFQPVDLNPGEYDPQVIPFVPLHDNKLQSGAGLGDALAARDTWAGRGPHYESNNNKALANVFSPSSLKLIGSDLCRCCTDWVLIVHVGSDRFFDNTVKNLVKPYGLKPGDIKRYPYTSP